MYLVTLGQYPRNTCDNIILYDVCSVYWEIFSTLGVFSTLGTSGGYLEYIRGCSVCQRDIMIHVGDIMSTSGFSIQIKGFYQLAPPHGS